MFKPVAQYNCMGASMMGMHSSTTTVWYNPAYNYNRDECDFILCI